MTIRMTAAELIEMQQPKKGKQRVQGAKRTAIGDESFDSAGEAQRWIDLCLLQQQGLITNLERQVTFTLMGAQGPILTPTGRPMQYRADFRYRNSLGVEVIEDFKPGDFRTEVYSIKKAILAAQGVIITEVTKCR